MLQQQESPDSAEETTGRSGLYVGIGRVLSHYDLDVQSYRLHKRGELLLPNNIQYGWPHSRLPVLYLSCGTAAGVNDLGDFACALTLDPQSGAPSFLGAATSISSRALHLTTDELSEHLLLAHTRPAGISVLRTDAQGAIVGQVDQRSVGDASIFAHQVRVSPNERSCILVTRGIPQAHEWNASTEPQAEPGSLHIFGYEHGILKESKAITIGDGYHFGPRNLDFHPSGSFAYLGLETQNEVIAYPIDADGVLIDTPIQRITTLLDPQAKVHQGVGPVLIHPQRDVLYVANRAYQPLARVAEDKVISADAENSIVVYSIDAHTGLLTEIQRISSGGACPRTLTLDPTGQMLVVANSETYGVRSGDEIRQVPMNLSTFRVLPDGSLEFQHSYQVDDPTGPEIAWSGIATY